MSPDDLVRYTFEAVQAWAAERDLPRRVGETPLEFACNVRSSKSVSGVTQR